MGINHGPRSQLTLVVSHGAVTWQRRHAHGEWTVDTRPVRRTTMAPRHEWHARWGRNSDGRWLYQRPRSLRIRPSITQISSRDLDVYAVGIDYRFCAPVDQRGELMKAWPALISGMLFGLGLTLSGMSDPAKVQGFLNVTGDWVPDLIFVMGGAVVVTVLLTPMVLTIATPLMADSFSLPLAAALDKRLIAGAILFGIGWGLSGYCPGPAIVSLLYGYESTSVFFIATLLGMSLESRISHWLSHRER